MSSSLPFGTCPVAIPGDGERITLAHGEGARMTRRLIERTILPRLGSAVGPHELNDAAHISMPSERLAFTTDSYVVSPLFFPGGDIGRLAVFGTVNDLAVSGAQPMWLSLSLIIEEGLPLGILEQVLESIKRAAQEAGVQITTGDTKVVPHGAADGLFINTSGIGRALEPPVSGPGSIQAGDELIITGPIGCHGLAILAARESLDLQPPPESDCASLWPLVSALHAAGLLQHVRAMRDATRGGLTAVLHEWSNACDLTLSIDETRIPITPSVRGASELLGLNPLYIANEGTMLLAVEPRHTAPIMAALRAQSPGDQACVIGAAQQRASVPVIVSRVTGTPRPLDEASGVLLPRIC
ncbi:MAG: hydrogenase expression/formation protein HypE [Planctomycetota bacterium]|nr:MAG: hydrogenase expression/formation protein HypE [Planctomycetota bacterium]